jgi:uncharacterized protein YhjY with autotransporter beta-barrel domain
MSKRVSKTAGVRMAEIPLEIRPPRPRNLARSALLIGTALGCSIAVFSLGAPRQAWAADECGAPTTSGSIDSVECTPAGNIYPGGITYIDTTHNLTVVLDPGVIAQSSAGTNAVTVGATGAGAYAKVTDSGTSIGTGNFKDGIYAYTSGGGDVTINNAAEVEEGFLIGNGLVGVTRAAGNVSITNTGYTVVAYSGVKAFAHDGSTSIQTGPVRADASNDPSLTGPVFGVYSKAYFGDSYQNDGSIEAHSESGAAFGSYSAATYRDVALIHGGVDARTYSGGVIGVRASSGDYTAAKVYGSVTATDYTGEAIGVLGVSSITTNVYVEGSTYAGSKHGEAIGILASGANYATVYAKGDVTAVGGLEAIGVYVTTQSNGVGGKYYNGDVTIHGNVTATSSAGLAYGVVSKTTDATYIDVTGNVSATGTFGAAGIVATSATSVVVIAAGDISASSSNGNAYGLKAYSYAGTFVHADDVSAYARVGNATGIYTTADGQTRTYISGNVTATSKFGYATGVETALVGAGSGYLENVEVGGNITVSGYAGAMGVYMHSATARRNNDLLGVTGVVSASTNIGSAEAIFVDDAYTADLKVGGASAYAKNGDVNTVSLSVDGDSVFTSYGDVTAVAPKGGAIAIITDHVGSDAGTANDITVHGNVAATGQTLAIGVYAEFGDVDVHVDGNVTANANAGNAYGVFAKGDLTEYVGGDVSVVAAGGGGATGMLANAITGDAYVHVVGNVSATATGIGAATGVDAYAGGNTVTVNVGGVVSAITNTGTATGVEVTDGAATANITVGGLYAYSKGGFAQGAELAVQGNLTFTSNGDIYAKAATSTAWGLNLTGTDNYNNDATVHGNVTANGRYGAYGVYALNGDINIHVDGDVTVKAANGNAFGVYAKGDLTEYVGGDVTVTAGGAHAATGMSADAVAGDAYIHVGGDVSATATGTGIAIGVNAEALGNTVTVNVGGVVSAVAYGTATGVFVADTNTGNITVGGLNAYSEAGFARGAELAISGSSTLTSNGDIYAKAPNGRAWGLELTGVNNSGNDATVHGNVTATGQYGAFGVYARNGDINIHIDGDVSATAADGNAYGVDISSASFGENRAYVGGNVTVQAGGAGDATGLYGQNTSQSLYLGAAGNVSATATGVGDAFGVEAYSGHDLHITVGGVVSAVANSGDAFGVKSYSTYDAYIHLGGVSAYSKAGDATGLNVSADDGITARVYGDITVTAPGGVAKGVDVYATAAAGAIYRNTVTVTGNVSANGDGGAVGVYMHSDGQVTRDEINITGGVGAYTTVGNATGILLEDVVTANVTVGGGVVAITENGYATGVSASLTGDGVFNLGGVYAHSLAQGDAYGLQIDSSGGAITANISGNVTAKAEGFAVGAYIHTLAAANVTVGGSVYAYSGKVAATGLNVSSTGSDVTVYVGGDVYAKSALDRVTGIETSTTSGHADEVTVKGDVRAVGYGTAVGVDADGGDIDIHVYGNVVAESVAGDATGIRSVGDNYVYVGHNVQVTSVSGVATGVYGNSTGYMGAKVVGNVYAASFAGNATGVNVISGFGDTDVYVGGNVTAKSYGGEAIGIQGNAAIGAMDVTVNGDVYAGSHDGNATGIVTYSDDESSIHVGGDVTAVSYAGAATAINTSAFDDVYTFVGGKVTALSTNGVATGVDSVVTKGVDYSDQVVVNGEVVVHGAEGAYGVIAANNSDFGFTSVHVGGNVTAITYDNNAIGVVAVGDGANVYIGGSVYAYSRNGSAFGVNTVSANDATTYIKGDVRARSYLGSALGVVSVGSTAYGNDITIHGNVTAIGETGAFGVEAIDGEVDVHVSGNVYAGADTGPAFGVKVVGDSYTYIGGNVTALATAGNATGVSEVSTGYAGVHVKGGVYAHSIVSGNATGITVTSGGVADSNVFVGGDLEARADAGNATGIDMTSGRYATVYVGGNVSAIAKDGVATGITASSGAAYGTQVTVKGNVGVYGYAGGYGIVGNSTGYAFANVFGAVYAGSHFEATGVNLTSGAGDFASTFVGGSVEAKSADGNATGILIDSGGFASATVEGDVIAIAPKGEAYGIMASGGAGDFDSEVYVGGNVTVAGYANAVGIKAKGTGYTHVVVEGSVHAYSADGTAGGVAAESGKGYDTDVTVGGSVKVVGETGAYGVNARSGGAVYVTLDHDVYAASFSGKAVGVVAYGLGGNATVTVDGNVTALSIAGVASGVEAASLDNIDITIHGSVTAESVGGGGAVGVTGVAEGNVSVHVDGPILAQGAIATGVDAYSSNGGNISVNVGDVVVHQSGGTGADSGSGIQSYSSGVSRLYAGNVTTTGDYTDGVKAGSRLNPGAGGDTFVTVNSVVTTGNYSVGIAVYGAGNATVHAGSIYTKGYASDGVFAHSLNGGVDVTVGQVVTKGDYSYGVYAAAGGPVVVHSTYVATFGTDAFGISAFNLLTTPTDTVAVYSGTVITHGDFSTGVFAGGDRSTYVKSGLVETYGDDAKGIFATGFYGPVTVNSGTVRTYGGGSTGIYALSTYGVIDITSGAVTTEGFASYGIQARSFYNDVNVTSGYVKTLGVYADGVIGQSYTGNVSITSATVITQGYGATAITGRDIDGDVTVKSTYIATHGDRAYGIYAVTYGGDVAITSNTVKTYGELSTGVVGESVNGNVTIDSTYVRTNGDFSYGVVGGAMAGAVSVTSTEVITKGDYSRGISTYSGTGDTTIASTEVFTYGAHSVGIYALATTGNISVGSTVAHTAGDYADGIHTITQGSASVTSTQVYTGGYQSIGIYAYGAAGSTVKSTQVVTKGDFSSGIVAIAPNGKASVTSNYVYTDGYHAVGIEAYGYAGTTVNNTGEVKTEGLKSVGIEAYAGAGTVKVTSAEIVTYGDYAKGIAAVSTVKGDVDITTNEIFTYGYAADGVYAVAVDGSVNITTNDVIRTSGDFSDGIFAASVAGGNLTVTNNGDILTSGFAAYGMYVFANAGTVTVYNNNLIETQGTFSDGIFAAGVDGTKVYSYDVITEGDYAVGIDALAVTGNVLVVNQDLVETTGYDADAIYTRTVTSGAVTVVNYGEVVAEDGVGVHINSAGHADVYNFGDIYGGRGGIVSHTATGAYIYNADGAVISGGNGYAIGVSGGAALINNFGSIYGYAHLSANADVVNNHGTWFAYGTTTFGAGTDTFNNSGLVKVAPFSSTATTTNWTGLEAFNNSGLVDLRNGHTGDVFNLTADVGGTTFTGTGSSALAVDATLGLALTSDRMNIGAAAGTTGLIVHDLTPGATGVLNFTGTTVVHGTSGSASNFTWTGETKGFVDYELHFFSGPVNWNIVGLPGQAAFEMLKAPQMAQDYWRRTGDAWSAREQEIRDSMWGSTPGTRGEGWEMWAQAQVGGENLDRAEHFTIGGIGFTPNLSTDSDWRGFQMGGDNWTSHNWLLGFTGGFLEQNTSFNQDKNSFDMTGWNLGAYAGFTSGKFFFNGLVKGDVFDLKANMHTVPAYETFSGNTWGAKAEAGWRMGGNALYLEPLADLCWTSTHLDDANFPGQLTTFTFGTATSLRGSIGARLGGQWGSVLPYVGIYAAQEFDGKNSMTMLTGAGCPSCMTIEDLKPGSYERADFGFTTTSWNGLEGFLKGEVEFGGHTTGSTGQLGVRWRW